MAVLDIDTPHGLARAHLDAPARPVALLALGHGAGGSIAAPDLRLARTAGLTVGLAVALVEQPYRVAGRRSAAPAHQLDTAWLAVVAALRAQLGDLPLVAGGRSSGARVACRTAGAAGAGAVLCLAFPLHPPGAPEKSRLPELAATGVPTLVVQGRSDAFGVPQSAAAARRKVVRVAGEHGLKKEPAVVAAAIGGWLAGRPWSEAG